MPVASTKGRNISIDFFRFFFMVIICIYHYGIHVGPRFQHGYMGVEFFFIVSGIFLYNSYLKKKESSPLDYFVSRVRRLWGQYLLALLFYWIVYLIWMIIQRVDFDFENYSLRLLSDSFMLQGLGLSFRGLCTPMWYVGSLVVAGTLVFSLLSCNEKLSIRVLLPFGSLLGYTYMTAQGTFDFYYSYYGVMFIPILRAYSGIAFGVLLGAISEKKNEELRESRTLIDVMSVLSVALLLIYVSRDVRVDGHTYTDNLLLLFICIVILACLTRDSLFHRVFKSRCWKSLGGITYEMLLIHSPIMILVNFCRKFFPMHEWIWLTIFLVVVILCSYLFKLGYNWITTLFNKDSADNNGKMLL